MKLLGEIVRREGLKIDGRMIYREAVRGIIMRDDKLLMIYSPHNGDYKFPGGGVERDEAYEEALLREIREETGIRDVRIEREFGCVVEYDRPAEPEYDLFKMISRYYVCQVDSNSGFGAQRLDGYEEDLGFTPVWVDVATAIQTNTAVLNSPQRPPPRWTRRDTFVLRLANRQLFGKMFA